MKKLLLILALTLSVLHAADHGPSIINQLNHIQAVFSIHKQSNQLVDFIKDLKAPGTSATRSSHPLLKILNDMAGAAERGNWKLFHRIAKSDRLISSRLYKPWYKKPGVWAGITGTIAAIVAGGFAWHKWGPSFSKPAKPGLSYQEVQVLNVGTYLRVTPHNSPGTTLEGQLIFRNGSPHLAIRGGARLQEPHLIVSEDIVLPES